MQPLILHHFDYSPFAEKARLMFGVKRLSWHSVEIPMVMPKPDLTALTGGYRKTPVLQIGADIYCDTRLIAVELEKRFPAPTLFPDGNRGMSLALSSWSDRAFFEPGAGLSMALNKSGLPSAVIEDRKAFFNFMDFDRLERDVPHLSTQLRVQADYVEQQLTDGRAFLFGAAPGLADINAYFPVWMARGHIPSAEVLLTPFTRLQAWERRMQSIGHGTRTSMTAAEAQRIARESTSAEASGVDADSSEPLQLKLGDWVSVAADDYGKDAATGRLRSLTLHEVAIERTHPSVGTVTVHFPRAGYRIEY